MVQYVRAKAENREAIIDFLNMVFSQAHEPHEFRTLLPKVYGEGRGHADIHVIALDEGRVRGCVAMYRFDEKIADETLKIGYIGSVSAHIQDHGAGHMKKLVQMQLDIAEEEGLDMLSLGGQRQRYGYFGFEQCGLGYGYTISAANIRHAFKDAAADGIEFVEMKEDDVPFAYDMFEKLPMHGTRTPENFLITAHSWNAVPYVVLMDGRKAGYIISDPDHDYISEMLLTDYTKTLNVVKAWFIGFGLRSLRFNVAPFMPEINKALASVAEETEITNNGMLKLLKPERVIRAYMKLKAITDGPLADGRTVIAIDGKNIKIEVKNSNIEVEAVNEKAEAEFTGIEAVKLFFACNRFAAPGFAEKLPVSWLPLPIYLMGSDHF